MAGNIKDENAPLIKTGRALDKAGQVGSRALRDVNFITDLGNFTNDYMNKHNDAAANDLTNFTTSMLVGAVGDAVADTIISSLSVTLGPELLIGLGAGIAVSTIYNIFYNDNLLGTRTNVNRMTNCFKYGIEATQNSASKLIDNAKDMIHTEDCKLWN